MNALVPYIWAAGGVQLLIAGANLLLPSRLRYRENLSKVSPIIRQIFVVHSLYIVLVLLVFSALCFLHAPELAGGGPLGKFLSGCLALFWSLRVPIQLFWYDPEVKKQNPLANVVMTMALLFLSGIFAVAALGAE